MQGGSATETTAAEQSRALNELFSSTFDSVLRIEQRALDNRLTEGLTISELHTIAAVGMYDRSPMNAIASRLDVTLATVTAAITKLEKKGYVERKRNQDDRRQVLVNLTTKGRKACRAHDMFHQKMVERALETLNPDETRALLTSLAKVKEFFDDEYRIASEKKDAVCRAVAASG